MRKPVGSGRARCRVRAPDADPGAVVWCADEFDAGGFEGDFHRCQIYPCANGITIFSLHPFDGARADTRQCRKFFDTKS